MVGRKSITSEKSVHFPDSTKPKTDGDSDMSEKAVEPSNTVGGMLRRASMAVFSSEIPPEEIHAVNTEVRGRQMSIFVDSGESCGLPSLESPTSAASDLVHSARDGFKAKRNTYDSAKNILPRDEEEGSTGSYDEGMIEASDEEEDVSSRRGVLSTLIAISSAAASSPSPRRLSSSSATTSYMADSDSLDSEDEGVAKLKFTEQNRTKREKSFLRELGRGVQSTKHGASKSLAIAVESTLKKDNTPTALTSKKLSLPRNGSSSLSFLNNSIGDSTSTSAPHLIQKLKTGSKLNRLSGKLGFEESKSVVKVERFERPYTENSAGYHLHYYPDAEDGNSISPFTACEDKTESDTDTLVSEPEAPIYVLKKGQNGPPSIYAFGFPADVKIVPSYYVNTGESTLQREDRDWEEEKNRRQKRKEKKLQQQAKIVNHVAEILKRQEFVMKLGRAFMMFGAPSHRLEAQLQATARVLEIDCQVVYIPGVMLVSFGDIETHTSEIKFLKQANGLDLGKLTEVYHIYRQVIHDRISVVEASVSLNSLMTAPPKFSLLLQCVLGGLASALIQISSFHGSFLDACAGFFLGALLVVVRVVVSKNDLYSSLFEIVMACCCSFFSAALASTGQFCFASVASGSIVSLLPGYIILVGSLELANRSIISGSVRLVYAVLYALFLGFGLSMGGEIWQRISGAEILNGSDYSCSVLRVPGTVWFKAAPPTWVYFITVPIFLLVSTMKNNQPLRRINTILMIAFAFTGWIAALYATKVFPSRPDITVAIGAFTVGILGNIYGKLVKGSVPFVLMLVGVTFQVPSGLSSGGLLNFATKVANGNASTSAYSSAGFNTAASLIQVAIGLTVGLFVSTALVNILPGGRKRGSSLSSF